MVDLVLVGAVGVVEEEDDVQEEAMASQSASWLNIILSWLRKYCRWLFRSLSPGPYRYPLTRILPRGSPAARNGAPSSSARCLTRTPCLFFVAT